MEIVPPLGAAMGWERAGTGVLSRVGLWRMTVRLFVSLLAQAVEAPESARRGLLPVVANRRVAMARIRFRSDVLFI